MVILPVQEMVAMSLHGLDNGKWIAKHGVHNSILSKIVNKFCRVVKKHLQSVFVQILSGS